MSHLTESQIDELRVMLIEEKQDLEEHLQITEEDGEEPDAGHKESLSESTGELSSYDNHPADLATETFERERDMAVDRLIEEKLQQTEHSLKRIEDGEYGICEKCGEDIPFKRLQAIPYTSYCIEHTPDRDSDESRPVEEQVMILPSTDTEQKSITNDDADAWKSVESYGSSDSPVSEDEPLLDATDKPKLSNPNASR